jgi:transcriptional regulator with XRE-family HTH domain
VSASIAVGRPDERAFTLNGMGTTLKERLLLAMKQAPGVKQVDLANACGIKEASVSDWFTGKTKSLAGGNLIRAAKLLNVNADWLGTGRGPMRLNASSVNADPPKNSYPEVTSEAQLPRLDTPTLHEALTLLMHDEEQAGDFPTLLARTERLAELYRRVAADGGRLSAAGYRQLGEEIEQRRGNHGAEARRGRKRH